jgi:hypothetical protein
MPIPTDVSNETPIYNKLSSYICINHFSLEKYFHKQKNVKAIKNQGQKEQLTRTLTKQQN